MDFKEKAIFALAQFQSEEDPRYVELRDLLRKKYGNLETTRMEIRAHEEILKRNRRMI